MHALRIDDPDGDKLSEEIQQIVEDDAGVGKDHALGGSVGYVAFVPKGNVLDAVTA